MNKQSPKKLTRLKIVCQVKHDIDISVLTHMYLPLIGQNALTGYLWLLNEGQFLKTEQDLETSLTRLSKHLELPLGRVFSEVLNILEGVSLVKTYLEGEEGYYICKVMSPLSVEEFINTTHLSVLAKNIIGKSNWERTLAFFLKEETPPSSAINISKKFDSFYKKAIKRVEPPKQDDTEEYDFSILESRLKEKGLEVTLRKSIQKRIVVLSNVYSFHPGDVANVIERCLNRDEGKLYVKSLSSCFSDLYEEKTRKEPDMFFDLKEGTYLERIEPAEFIDLCEERPATLMELELIQDLSNKFRFDSKTINMLLHFSFIKNKFISINYLLKIAATLKKQNLKTTKDIGEHLKKAYINASKKKIEETQLTTEELKMDAELKEVGDYFTNRDKK